MKKTILVISNPFGYGPAGKAMTIISVLKNKLNIDDVVYTGGKLGIEIADFGIEILSVNERDENALLNLFKTVQNPHIISSQNRHAIRVAKRMGIPSAFFDGLAWFWQKVPDDHFLADITFWPRFPNIVSVGNSKIQLVGAIIEKSIDIPSLDQRECIIITLGGIINPLVHQLPLAYLDLFIQGINSLNYILDEDRIIVACSRDALNYLREKISNPGVYVENLKHIDFINLLKTSKHLITTGGQTATTESFSLAVPVSFLLPINLSQYALVQLLKQNQACPQALEWQSYVDVHDDIRSLSERDAMVEFDIYAKRILADTSLLSSYIDGFCKIIQQIPNNEGQKKFISHVGTNGAQEIADFLIKRWDLQ